MGLRSPALSAGEYLRGATLPLNRRILDIPQALGPNIRVKFIKLITLFSLLIIPQIHQAWGESHCVNDCHEEKSLGTHKQDNQSTKANESQKPEKGQSHHHFPHCVHTFTVVLSLTSLQNPHTEYKKLTYHFTLYESEPHLNVYIEPPILSSLTFA